MFTIHLQSVFKIVIITASANVCDESIETCVAQQLQRVRHGTAVETGEDVVDRGDSHRGACADCSGSDVRCEYCNQSQTLFTDNYLFNAKRCLRYNKIHLITAQLHTLKKIRSNFNGQK